MTPEAFYYVKGTVSLIATLLLIGHMVRAWNYTRSPGQRLRYMSLFYFAAYVTFASVRQVAADDPVNILNVGALIGAALLVVTAAVSIREGR